MHGARVLLISTLFAISCADKGSSSDGSGSGGSGTDSGSGSGSGSDTGTSGGESCEDFESDTDIAPAVTIKVTHQGTAPVYFTPSGCGGGLPIAIKQEGGEPFPWSLGECFPLVCEQFLGAEDCSLGCNDCEPPSFGVVEQGADKDASWSGVLHERHVLPAACASGFDCDRECLRPSQAPPGAYVVELTAYQGCEGECECTENTNDGVCLSWSGTPNLDQPITISAQFDYPAETSVELVFQD